MPCQRVQTPLCILLRPLARRCPVSFHALPLRRYAGRAGLGPKMREINETKLPNDIGILTGLSSGFRLLFK